jgi:N-acetylmuramoyl-L-alanine amidase
LAASNSEILNRADKLTKSPSKTEVFRAYNDYKNVYLRSMMHSNLDERLRALKGIVISGKKLHIDVSKYQKELNSLKKNSVKTPVVKKKKRKKTEKKLILNNLNVLKNAEWKNDELYLKFDRKLLNTDVNFIKLFDEKKKSFRYIFDVHARKTRSIYLHHNSLKRVKVAQFSSKILRVVLESEVKLKLRFRIENNYLKIFPHFKNSSKKQIEKKAKKVQKSYKKSSNVLKGKTVVIDPGHGGKDTGAIGYKKYREKNIVFEVSKAIAKYLRSRGARVYLTRSNDKFIKLRNRTKYANKKKADIFISIHANSVPKKNALKAKGIETYFLSRARSSRATRVAAIENSKEIEDMNYFGKNNLLNFMNREKIVASNKLAIDVQRGMLSNLRKYYKDVKDNGVREGPFWILVGAQMPAVLIEIGFISYPKEARRLVDKKYQQRLAKGISDGIERYFINNR